MEFLIGIIAACLGAALTWLFLRSQQAVLLERLRSSEELRGTASAELDASRAVAQSATLEIKRLSSDLAAERAAAEARLDELRKAHERLRSEFAELSGAALRANRDDFLQLAQSSFGQFSELAQKDHSARQQAVADLIRPLRDSLDKVDQQVNQLERTRATAYGALAQQLEALQTAQLRLQAEASRLASALSTTRTAGTWGEVQLRRVVELAGLTEHCDFVEQATPGDGSRDRADLVVQLPGNQRIVIDAKAPTEAFREAAQTTDPEQRAARLAEHAARVRQHCDDLAGREYWAKFQPSPEFVVLFLPGDAFLSAALEADPALMDRAIGRKVLLATPSTLIALLKAAAYGWRQEALSRNAEQISQLGRQLYDRLAHFSEHLDKTGRSLDAAVRSFNSAVGTYESTVLPGARKFAELGARGTKESPAPSTADTTPRSVLKKE